MATEQLLPPPTNPQPGQEACASYKSCTQETTWLAPTVVAWALAGRDPEEAGLLLQAITRHTRRTSPGNKKVIVRQRRPTIERRCSKCTLMRQSIYQGTQMSVCVGGGRQLCQVSGPFWLSFQGRLSHIRREASGMSRGKRRTQGPGFLHPPHPRQFRVLFKATAFFLV